MNKIFGIVVVAILAYFLFAKSSDYPKSVTLQGYVMSSQEDKNNSLEKGLDVISYHDDNRHHMMMFAILGGSDITVERLLDQYLGRFRYQGFTFISEGDRLLGRKGNQVIYLTRLHNYNGIAAYVETNPSISSATIGDVTDIYSQIENFSF